MRSYVSSVCGLELHVVTEACLQRAMTYTHDACAGIQKDRNLTFRPKFKSVFKGDVGGVRDGEGAVKNGGDREDDAEFSDRVDEDEDEDEEDETDEEVEDEEGEESAPQALQVLQTLQEYAQSSTAVGSLSTNYIRA